MARKLTDRQKKFLEALFAEANGSIKDAKIIAGYSPQSNSNEIIYGSGATHLINLIANSWGRKFLKPDDEIIITIADHHANIVPWQLVSQQTGSKIHAVPVDKDGNFDIKDMEKFFVSKI